MSEQLCPRNSGPSPHTHVQQDSFYVLEGQMTVIVGGETLIATQGSFVNVPPNTVHSFRVDTETARILNMYVPSGFERIITELGEPAPERVLPPSGRPMRGKPEDVRRVSEAIGMRGVNEPDKLRTNLA